LLGLSFWVNHEYHVVVVVVGRGALESDNHIYIFYLSFLFLPRFLVSLYSFGLTTVNVDNLDVTDVSKVTRKGRSYDSNDRQKPNNTLDTVNISQ
jgi:hypothetical protein